MNQQILMYAEKGHSSGLTQKGMRFFSSTRNMFNYFEQLMRQEYETLQVQVEVLRKRIDEDKEIYNQNYERRMNSNLARMRQLSDQDPWDFISTGYRNRFYLVEVDSEKKPKKITVKKLKELAQQGF